MCYMYGHLLNNWKGLSDDFKPLGNALLTVINDRISKESYYLSEQKWYEFRRP